MGSEEESKGGHRVVTSRRCDWALLPNVTCYWEEGMGKERNSGLDQEAGMINIYYIIVLRLK